MSQVRQGSASLKIAGGKMVRVDVRYTNVILDLKLTGDFFLHPEETISALEACLAGASLPLEAERLIEKLQTVLEDNRAELIGATSQDILAALHEALA